MKKNADGTWESKIYKLTLMMEDVQNEGATEVIGVCDLDLAKFVNSEREQVWALVQDKTYEPKKPKEVFLKGDKGRFRKASIGFKLTVNPDLSTAKPASAASVASTPPRSQPSSTKNITSQESAAKRIIQQKKMPDISEKAEEEDAASSSNNN